MLVCCQISLSCPPSKHTRTAATQEDSSTKQNTTFFRRVLNPNLNIKCIFTFNSSLRTIRDFSRGRVDGGDLRASDKCVPLSRGKVLLPPPLSQPPAAGLLGSSTSRSCGGGTHTTHLLLLLLLLHHAHSPYICCVSPPKKTIVRWRPPWWLSAALRHEAPDSVVRIRGSVWRLLHS